MAVPANRADFKKHVLRMLGAPVIEINVDDDQLDDRIDEAIKYWQDYHYDGTEKVYLDHVIDANTVANKAITLGDEVIGVVSIFDMGFGGNVTGDMLTNIPFQLYVSDVTGQGMTGAATSYAILKVNLQLMQEVLVGRVPIRFNRHRNTLYLDINPARLQIGSHIIVEAYVRTDPEQYPDAYGDWWLQRYAAALVKRQWGDNLSKFSGIPLPGGLTLDGPRIRAEAQDTIDALEREVINSFSIPVHEMTG